MCEITFLLHGIDTLQCAYYLHAKNECAIDFLQLAQIREELKNSKSKSPAAIDLAGRSFLLRSHDSGSGYHFILENEDFKIEMGEFNNPNFFVTFKSQALWRESAWLLHEKFLKLAASLGLTPHHQESISLADFAFDYHIPQIDFDEDHFKSRSAKDMKVRENGKPQTFSFGKKDIVLRVYDKIAEIIQQSAKVWFFLLWGCEQDVWRIEWQVRKTILKRFGIRTFDDLEALQGDLLRYLATEHDTLRTPSNDSNSSRWPLHPLWIDLQERISNLQNQGVHRVIGRPAALEERLQRITTSVHGYLKQAEAIRHILYGSEISAPVETLAFLKPKLRLLYEPLEWESEVEKRIKNIEGGEW